MARKRVHSSIRKLRSRSRKHGVLAGIWAITTALFTISWIMLGGTLWLVAALLGGLATVLLTIATFNPDSVVPATAAPKPRSANPRESKSGPPARRKSGTAPRKRVCSARCQRSTKPKETCNCSCGGRTHGVRNGPTSVPQPKPPQPSKPRVGEVMRRVS